MSSPATSCSRRYTDSVSTYCSRNRVMTIASRNDLVPRFSVYQLGRGSEPMMVVGSIFPAVAFNMPSLLWEPVEYCHTGSTTLQLLSAPSQRTRQRAILSAYNKI